MPTLILEDVSPRLLADVDAWARLRRTTRARAAEELLRVGVDVTSERAARTAGAALVVHHGRRRHAEDPH